MSTRFTRLELRDFENNHKKFWEISEPEPLNPEHSMWRCACRWGRIGTHGQEQWHTFETFEEGARFVRRKLDEKLRKGYVRAAGRSGPRSVAEATQTMVPALLPSDDPFALEWRDEP